MIHIISFSYRDNETPADDSDHLTVFDCRNLRNPYNDEALRQFNGQHEPVRRHVFKTDYRPPGMIHDALGEAMASGHLFDGNFAVAFGCTGGQHRSVSMAIMFQSVLSTLFIPSTITHLNLENK